MKLLAPLTENFELIEIGNNVGSRLLSEMELRMHDPMTPNSEILLKNVRRVKKFSRVRTLAISSWLLGPIGFLLREEIRTFCLKHFEPEKRVLLELYLFSRISAERACSLNFSERDWFGNQIPAIRNELEVLQLEIRLPTSPLHQERIRGYRDHGTLRPPHQWLEKFDWSLNQEFERIEREREYFNHCVQLLSKFLTELEGSYKGPHLEEMIRKEWANKGGTSL